MGHTNYAYHKQYTDKVAAKAAFAKLVEFAPFLFEEAEAQGIAIGNGHGVEGSKPIITEREILFNGAGHGNSYETCSAELSGMLPSTRPSYPGSTHGFTSCKTARKPYDPVVLAFYMQGKKLGVFAKWSSDGSDEPDMMNPGKLLLALALKRQKADAKRKKDIAKKALEGGAKLLDELPRRKTDYIAEHARHPKLFWIEEVREGRTLIGYWDWVADRLQEEAQERKDRQDPADAEVA